MIYLATDHAGFKLKEFIKQYLLDLDWEIKDMGNFVYDENDDYPDWIKPAALAVADDLKKRINSYAIVFGGSGQGEAMVANRIQDIRAAVVYNYQEEIIRLSRLHNNANILSIGARFITSDEAKHIIKLWLETKFSKDERHQRRINKLN